MHKLFKSFVPNETLCTTVNLFISIRTVSSKIRAAKKIGVTLRGRGGIPSTFIPQISDHLMYACVYDKEVRDVYDQSHVSSTHV